MIRWLTIHGKLREDFPTLCQCRIPGGDVCLKNTTSWLDTNRWHHFMKDVIQSVPEYRAVRCAEILVQVQSSFTYVAIGGIVRHDRLWSYCWKACGLESHVATQFMGERCDRLARSSYKREVWEFESLLPYQIFYLTLYINCDINNNSC